MRRHTPVSISNKMWPKVQESKEPVEPKMEPVVEKKEVTKPVGTRSTVVRPIRRGFALGRKYNFGKKVN